MHRVNNKYDRKGQFADMTGRSGFHHLFTFVVSSLELKVLQWINPTPHPHLSKGAIWIPLFTAFCHLFALPPSLCIYIAEAH